MANIEIKAIEYPEEKVLNLDDLTQNGLIDLKEKALNFIEEIELLISQTE